MARCEDYPCCGHVGDDGPCPDFDPETGKQLNMKCTCGASVPLGSRFSICAGCLRRGGEDDGYSFHGDVDPEELDDEDDEDEDDPEFEDYGDHEFAMYGYDYPEDY
jgi:hypothetical protein